MRIVGWLVALNVVGIAAGSGCDSDTFATTSSSGTGGNSIVEDAGSISGLALINPTCGVGDGGTVSQACVDCTAEHCESEFNACFGSDWQNDLESGICSAFGTCVENCDCGDHICFNDCLQALDANQADPCRACIINLIACELTHCESECEDLTGNPDAGTGGSTSGSGSGSGHAGSGGAGSG